MTPECATHRFSVAPMMDWTDRHCRYFHRQISGHARLYTEMVTTGALLHGDVARHLNFDAAEHPVALQLGGCDPQSLARCARLAEDWGYDEVNLNCGCPSDRVQGGGFGACLMREPDRVADCIAAMCAATRLPVSVKCRIGVDDSDTEAFLDNFIAQIASAGCRIVIVHARKAWLQGLSPKQNRDVPPLDYTRVHRLKSTHPELTVVLNGGLSSLNAAAVHVPPLDGVMLGRAAYESPWLLSEVDPTYFRTAPPHASREQVIEAMRSYIQRCNAAGTPTFAITRHMLGLYRGQPGGRAFRRALGEGARAAGTTADILDTALAAQRAAAQQARPSTPNLETTHA